MPERVPYIIPQPKQAAPRAGEFCLDVHTTVQLLPGAGEADYLAARSLRDEIEEATGLRLAIVKVAHPVGRDNAIVLVSDPAAARDYLGHDLPGAGDLAGKGDQAYSVSVTPGWVVAGGEGATALHYAVQTLRQVARLEGAAWPAFDLVDWPTLRYRGVMLDVARGKVPTVETLKGIIDRLALCKANVLQLYTEHTYVFPHHPTIGQGSGSLDSADILELDAYARAQHVELMPNLNAFGHCAHLLHMDEYGHLAESAARWSLCPTDQATYTFLDDLFGDLLPSFNARTFNVGCDETWDLGLGRSAGEAERIGKGRLYLSHILRLHELAARHGCRIQMWGDILLHHPELVGQVPEDVTLLDWHYEAEEDYPSVRLFGESGRDFWVCPGTSSWNTLFPRIENSNGNIRLLAQLGARHGASGMLNTDWGDSGHYQPLGQCWYGYLYGLEQAWNGGATDAVTFDRMLGPLFFGAGGDAVVAAMRALGRLNTLPGMPRPNATMSIYALLDEPLVGAVASLLPAETLDEIVRVSALAERDLRGAVAASREPLSLLEMAYSARMMGYAARKALTSKRVATSLHALAQGQGDVALLREAKEAFHALDAELVELRDMFRDLWLQRARYAEIEITLTYLANLRERYASAQHWLQGRIADLAAGRTPDYTLTSYIDEAQDYEVLGQGFWRRMQAAGVDLD
ncbi:MAG: beta-N-acetylhexosaminidase [Anaerolineae bacterium]